MIIIGLTGFAASGKDTTANYLVKRHGFAAFTLSDIVKDECKRRGIEPTKHALAEMGNELRRNYGMDIVAKKLLERVTSSGADKAVMNGFRSVEEANYVRSRFGKKFVLIALHAERDKRHERRNRESPISREDFLARDENDIRNKGLDKVVAMADYTIDNNGSIGDLHKNIDDLMVKIL